MSTDSPWAGLGDVDPRGGRGLSSPGVPKPRSTLMLVGPRGHGKTRLAAGLRRACAAIEPGAASLDGAPDDRPLPVVHTAIESARRRYTLLDPGEPGALRRRVITGPLEGEGPIDGAVLVVDVDATHGPEFKDDLRLLRGARSPRP